MSLGGAALLLHTVLACRPGVYMCADFGPLPIPLGDLFILRTDAWLPAEISIQ